MIIPGHAVLSLFSPTPELQGPREEGSDFGQLLMKVEHQTTRLPDQEAGECRALESVLQVLMTMFQSFTPAYPAQAVSVSRAGESGVTRVGPAGGPAFGVPFGLVPTSGLEEPGGVNRPLDLVTDVSPNIEQPTLSTPTAVLGTPLGVTSLDTTPSCSGESILATLETPFIQSITPLIKAERQADTGVTADRVLPQAAASPGLPQMASATTGEGDRLTPETAPQEQQSPALAVESSNPLPASALAHGWVPLIQRPQQPIVFSIADRGHRSPVGLTSPGEASAASPERVSPGPTEPPTRMTSPASPRVIPIEFQSTPEQARPITASLLTGDETFQSPSVTSQPSPWAAAPAAPGMIHAAAPPLVEALVSLLALPRTDVAAHVGVDSSGLRLMVLAEEKAVFPERDPAPSARRAPESEEHAPESMSSMLHLTADHAFSSSRTGATSHIPSADSDTPVPLPSHPLEDVTGARPWSRPLPANTVLLHLEPPELGSLLVQVHVSEKRLIASFRAQSPGAEALLRAHLPALHESLSQQGFEVQPIAITQAAEAFSTHLGAGTGAFAQQHSAFQAFTQDRHAADTADTQSEVEMQRTPRWPAEQRTRLLDVVI